MGLRFMHTSDDWFSAVAQSSAPLVYLNTPRRAGKTTLLRTFSAGDPKAITVSPNFNMVLIERHALTETYGLSYETAKRRTCRWANDISPTVWQEASLLLIEEPNLCRATPMLDTDHPVTIDPDDGQAHYPVLSAREVDERWIAGLAGHRVIMAGTAQPPYSPLVFHAITEAFSGDVAECILVVADDAFLANLPNAADYRRLMDKNYYRAQVLGISDDYLFQSAPFPLPT